MPVKSFKDRVLAYAAKHPNASNAAVAKALGCSRDVVLKHRGSGPEPMADPVEAREEKTRAKRQAEQHEQMVTELGHLRARDRLFYELSGKPLPPVERYELNSRKREGTYVALLSDIHPEEEVKPGSVPNGNVYNLAIAELRIKRFFAAVEWQILSRSDTFSIRHLVLWLGGDLITNHLHDENVEMAQLGPVSAILWVLDRIYAGICNLLESLPQVERLDLVCSVGNHGRTTKFMRAATATEHSWEWLIYQVLAQRFKDKGETRVQVLADPTSHQYHTIYGQDYHWHHGHELKYKGGVGGITVPLMKAVHMWNAIRPCAVHHVGHFHQWFDGDQFVVNGSVIGYSPYAMSIRATPQDPLQLGYLIDSKRGKCSVDKLWVGDKSEERLLWNVR